MKFGVFLPSFILPGHERSHAREVRAFARRAEEIGFDSLWITDHVVTARRFYRVGWLDALVTLSHVAAITERVKLGTSILILPLRQPAVLAKEVATLQHLAEGRHILGVGVGWYAPEFEACGVAKSERGARTDEVLAATLALFSGKPVDFSGEYYTLRSVTVEPRLDPPPLVWSGGGSQLAHERSPEAPAMHPRVLARIGKADGWIARPTCPPDLIARDRRLIEAERAAHARSGQFTFAHENFTWISERGSRDEVMHEQQQRFGTLLSDERPWEYIDAVYMTGTIGEIQAKIEARIAAGVEYLMLHTLTADLEQLELIARHLVEPFADSHAVSSPSAGAAIAGRPRLTARATAPRREAEG